MTQRKNNTPYTAREKEKALKLLQRTKDMVFVAHRYHCTVRTLYRWKRSYDGTLESLENKSSRPHSVHPKAHTPEEVNLILRLVRRNPGIGLNELYGKRDLFHFDMYRLGSADELFDIGWEDYLDRGGVCAVEWSENVPEAFDGSEIRVSIEKCSDSTRKITIEGASLC